MEPFIISITGFSIGTGSPLFRKADQEKLIHRELKSPVTIINDEEQKDIADT
jgi:hypothetical protein